MMVEKEYFGIGDLLAVKPPEGKWGAFNSELKVVIPFEYDDLGGVFNDGRKDYVYAEKDGKRFFFPLDDISSPIDAGEIICETVTDILTQQEYQEAEPLIANLIREKDGKYGIADLNGNFIIEPVYDEIKPFVSRFRYISPEDPHSAVGMKERFLIIKDRKMGVASKEKVLCEPVYEVISNGDGYLTQKPLYWAFLAVKNDKLGYVNEDGKALSEFKYEDAVHPLTCCIGLAADENDVVDLINLDTNKVIYSALKEEVCNMEVNYSRIAFVNPKENAIYSMDFNGENLIKINCSDDLKGLMVSYLNDKMFAYQKVDEETGCPCSNFGVIGPKGNKLTEPVYSSITPIEGYSKVVVRYMGEDHKLLEDILDEDGNVVLKGLYAIEDMGLDWWTNPMIPPLYTDNYKIDLDNNKLIETVDEEQDEQETDHCIHFNWDTKMGEGFIEAIEAGDVNGFVEFEKDGKCFAYAVWNDNDDITVHGFEGEVLASTNFEISTVEYDDEEILDCDCGSECDCGGGCDCGCH